MDARHIGLATGLVQLGTELGLHLVDAVHGVHRSVASVQRPLGPAQPAPAPAPAVYAAIRAGFRLAHGSIGSLARLLRRVGSAADDERLLRIRSVVNGVFGHELVRTGNPLALPMTLEWPHGRSGGACTPTLLFLHGLCMSEVGWRRGDHPEFVARVRNDGWDVAFVRYNSGLRISRNAEELARLLEQEAGDGPLWMIGHSMGGLLARSSLHQAAASGLRWPRRVRALVTLGAPHDGAALERLGNHANRLLRVSPYTAPLSRLGNLRSEGIRDLRWGNLLESDWSRVDDPDHHHDPRRPLPLAAGVRHVFVAATRSAAADGAISRLRDDRLVAVPSALGHAHLREAAVDRHVLAGLDHMGLLGSRRVYALLRSLLRPA